MNQSIIARHEDCYIEISTDSILSAYLKKFLLEGEMELGVFGSMGLENFHVRSQLYRIPYVSLRISEVQKIIDHFGIKNLDLISIIQDDRKFCLLRREFQKLLVSLFCIGIYEKYKTIAKIPEQFIVNEDLKFVIDYLKAEFLGEKLPTRFVESYLRSIMRTGFFSSNSHCDAPVPVSYSLCTSHARWFQPSALDTGAPAMNYGLFFEFLFHSVKESNAQKIVYFGVESEEMISLKKVVQDRWPHVEVVSSIQQDATLSEFIMKPISLAYSM